MPETIRLTGGAAHSEVWVQIFADCFQIPVEVPAASELGALGAAIDGSVAVGCYKDYNEAVQTMVTFSKVQSPNPGQKEIYYSKYRNYNNLINALDPGKTLLPDQFSG